MYVLHIHGNLGQVGWRGNAGPLGYHNGRPVAALVIFRSCLQWKIFQADRTQFFDKIINTMGRQIEDQEENNNTLSYWLANTVTLLYLLQKNIKPASGGTYNSRIRTPTRSAPSQNACLY